MNTLILDDEQRYREHIRRALERKGLRIHVAATADDAREIVRALGVDLVIADIRLPGSTDGLDFAGWAREQCHDVALIVITGYSSPEYERRSRELGAIAYMEKPFDLKELEFHVQRAMERRQLLREIHRLEQQVAAATDGGLWTEACAELPLVCLDMDGGILRATSAGQEALDAVADPALDRPVSSVDSVLRERLQEACSAEEGSGWVTLYRRDGVLAEYLTMAWRCAWGGRQAISVLMLDSRQMPVDTAGTLWLPFVLRASGVGKPQAGRRGSGEEPGR